MKAGPLHITLWQCSPTSMLVQQTGIPVCLEKRSKHGAPTEHTPPSSLHQAFPLKTAQRAAPTKQFLLSDYC